MYNPDRAVFIAAIMLSEAEEALSKEKPFSHRYNRWKQVHEVALKLFETYDKNINKNTIYENASLVFDTINNVLEAKNDNRA